MLILFVQVCSYVIFSWGIVYLLFLRSNYKMELIKQDRPMKVQALRFWRHLFVLASDMKTSHKNVRFQVLSGTAEDSSRMGCDCRWANGCHFLDIYSVFIFRVRQSKRSWPGRWRHYSWLRTMLFCIIMQWVVVITQKSAVLSYFAVEACNHTLWLFLSQWHSHIPEDLNI